MCFHPIKIRNPSLYFNSDIDKPYIEVPCGHCEACSQNKVNDLVTRSYYEWQSTIKNGGFCYFDTLTYSEKSVPKLFGTMVFSRSHLTKFFKTLRITLERSGYQVTDNKKPLLKYLVTTEYGDDDRYSHRPHYHILWFVSIPNITLLTFYKYVRKVWTYQYKFGWNDKITDVMRHQINRIDGIRYVCKYLTKSSDYVDRFNRLIEENKEIDDNLLLIYKNLKNIKPFYRSSLGFGSSILDVDADTIKNYGVPIYTSKGIEFASIPRYIKYKLHYDKVRHPFDDCAFLYKRNNIGVQYLIDNLDKVIDAKTLLYKNVLENESIFSDDDYKLKDFVMSKLDGRSLRDFIIYKCIYKGHMFSELCWHSYSDYFAAWLLEPRSIKSPFTNKKELDDYLNTREHSIITDKSKVEFFDFDEIDSIFDYLFEKYNHYQELSKLKKKNEEEQTTKIIDRFCRSY